jgi:hypothetical protein
MICVSISDYINETALGDWSIFVNRVFLKRYRNTTIRQCFVAAAKT